MSYTVAYNPELCDIYPMKHRKIRKFSPNILLTTMAILIVLYTLNTIGVLHYLIPGDHAVTTGAFSNMVSQVQNGENVSDAIFCFVKDVITGGIG